MGNPAAPYRMIGVAAHRTFERTVKGAPSNNVMAAFAEINKLDFVVRYYPSRKGWMVTDMRQRRRIILGGSGRTVWDSRTLKRAPRTFPSEDAAVMWAMHQTGIEIIT